MKKRILSIMLTLCLIMAFMPQTAFAATSGSENGLNYTISDAGEVTITGYDGSATEVTIPSTINGNPVTAIGSNAFSNKTTITSVTIPGSVTTIGVGAFYGCEGLASITIPNSVTTIGASAFDICKRLTSITIPNSVAFIGEYAFRKTPWLGAKQVENPLVVVNNILIDGSTATGEVSITEDITSIGDYAFASSKIKSITIPGSVTYIGTCAFYNCSSLTRITIPNSVTSIRYATFQSCESLISVTIPNSVSSIGEHAFHGCKSLTSITIPNSVTSIRNRAFQFCTNLTSITIPNSVRSIEQAAFWGCTGLTSITIPNSVTSIGESAFRDCTGLTSVTIPNSVTSIGKWAFMDCTGLESIFLPNEDNLTIGSNAIPAATSQVKYSLDTEGKVTITGIALGTGKTGVAIPATICGYPVVAVADNYQELVGTHTCKGGTATCAARALCDICGKEYGALKEHTYNWQSQDGKYWSKCQYCGYETTKKDIPTITINGVDSVCATQDYEFSFTLPQGVTDATYGCDFGNRGFGGIDPTIENGKMCGVIDASLYGTSEGSFKIIIDAKTADGFDFSVSKTVALNKEHLDSEPKDHLCDICGATVSGHNLEKISAKDATVTETGNKEYWHCKDCGKYFSDENGKSEIIDLAAWKTGEGKLAKLPPEIINGKGMSIAAGETKELTFRSNADFSDFIRVELDGKTLDAKYYTAKEGSTIITLKADYVASLSAGNHTIGIVSTSGTATAKFTVDAKAAPKTGDNSNLILWLALLFVSGGMMTVTGGYKKREKHS